MDYGAITVFLQTGLTEDQTYVIVRKNVENQLITCDRKHYIDILDQCTRMALTVPAPFAVVWNLRDYTYKFSVEVVE